MAEEPVGLTVAEKFFGLLIILVGAIIFYVTYKNIESVGQYPIVFLGVGSALMAVGILLVIARPE